MFITGFHSYADAMSKDLRTYLADIAKNYPDEIRVFADEVDPKFEITAYVEKLETKREDPVAFFKKVKGSSNMQESQCSTLHTPSEKRKRNA